MEVRTMKTFILMMLAVCALSTSCFAAVNLLANPGFETPESITGTFPDAFADWRHDVAEIRGAENGITPRTGSSMVRFINCSPSGPAIQASCDVTQLVDLSAY